jgi:hypothetical protein
VALLLLLLAGGKDRIKVLQVWEVLRHWRAGHSSYRVECERFWRDEPRACDVAEQGFWWRRVGKRGRPIAEPAGRVPGQRLSGRREGWASAGVEGVGKRITVM